MGKDKQALGRRGEELALRALRRKDMRLLERNYRAGRMEVDLILRDGDAVVFVEVKARSTDRYGLGREAVTPLKQQHLRQAALVYLAAQNLLECPARFDVAEVDLATGQVTHIIDAF